MSLVFGMSFGELAVVVIVALVVMGPKELPKVLRKLGQWAGKLRRMAADLRQQSGIDDALRVEGLDGDIQEIRKLARGDLDGVVKRDLGAAAATTAVAAGVHHPLEAQPAVFSDMFVERDRENPRDGADSYGALPDTSIVYENSLTPSALATDPLYVLGDADAKIPNPAPAEEPKPEAATAE